MDDFLDARDVANILEISEGRAYSLIRQYNSELKNNGHRIFKGRVSKRYFYEKNGLIKEEEKGSEKIES